MITVFIRWSVRTLKVISESKQAQISKPWTLKPMMVAFFLIPVLRLVLISAALLINDIKEASGQVFSTPKPEGTRAHASCGATRTGWEQTLSCCGPCWVWLGGGGPRCVATLVCVDVNKWLHGFPPSSANKPFQLHRQCVGSPGRTRMWSRTSLRSSPAPGLQLTSCPTTGTCSHNVGDCFKATSDLEAEGRATGP